MCSDVLRCSHMFSDDHRCFWIFSRYSIDVLLMFSRCSLDVLRMFAGFFQDVFRMLWWVLWAWWNFKWSLQMKVWTLMIQRNSMIPNYSMIPAIRWSIRSMDFDKPKVYGDTSITDGLVFLKVEPSCDQTWWDSLVFSILSCFSYVLHAKNTLVGPLGPF